MARPWLKVEPAVLKHPKTRALAKRWGCHPYQVVGFLVALWGYCLEFRDDGNLAACPPDVLDELAAPCLGQALGTIETVVEALQVVGLADEDGHLHDWEEYTGALVVQRRNERQRKRLSRKAVRRTGADASTGQAPDRRGMSGPRVEQSRVEQSTSSSSSASARLLHEHITGDAHEVLEGLLRAAQNPAAAIAVIRSYGPGGTDGRYTWAEIGQALLEAAAANLPFGARVLAGCLRKVREGEPPARGGAPGGPTDAERMARARAALEQGAA